MTTGKKTTTDFWESGRLELHKANILSSKSGYFLLTGDFGTIMLYRVKLKDLVKGIETTDETNARDPEQLKLLYETMGKQILSYEVMGGDDTNGNPQGAPQQEHNSYDNIPDAMLPPAVLEARAKGEENPTLFSDIQIDERVASKAKGPFKPNAPTPPPPAKEVIFEDKGTRYKIVDGDVYKEDWIECKKENYRIRKVTAKSNKDITQDVIVEKLDWIKLAD